MHELSIALSIVEAAEEQGGRLGGRVTAVHLRIGMLTGIVPEALQSSFGIACYDTPLQGSRLVIEEVPIVIHCDACGHEGAIDSAQMFCCTVCGTPCGDIRQGRELQITALEVEE